MVLRITMLCLVATLVSGCAVLELLNPPRPDDPAYAPVPSDQLKPPSNQNGGIYHSGYNISLFEDTKAKRVGDILTIVLVEKTTATKSSKTDATKKTEVNFQNPTLLGSTPQINAPGIIPLVSNNKNNFEVGVEADRTFAGEGNSDQSNQLDGNISVTVIEVLPNGNLIVRGEKWVKLNRGDEYIRITGMVRPIDIDPDNTVSSTKVANARITYSGTGEVADANVMGWLARFFISAFWPF